MIILLKFINTNKNKNILDNSIIFAFEIQSNQNKKLEIMNSKRLLLGTIAGFFGYFAAGGLLYTVVFKELLASTNPGMTSVQTEPNMVALVLGNLASAFLLAYIFEKWAGIRNPVTGAVSGALIGALIAFGYDSMIHGTTNLMTWQGVLVDVVVFAICSAIAGALTAFGLGYKRV